MGANKTLEKNEEKNDEKNIEKNEKKEKLNEESKEKADETKQKNDVKEKVEINHEINVKEKAEAKHEKKKSKKLNVIISVIIIIILIIIGSITIFSIININNKNIINGVKIDEINVSDKSIEDARKEINDYVSKKLNEDITMFYNEYELTIKPEQAGAIFYIDESIENAYAIGRNGNFLSNDLEIIDARLNGKNIELKLEIDNQILEKLIIEINENIEGTVKQPNYYIEGNELIIDSGKEGNTVDNNALKELIYSKIKEQDGDSKKIEIPVKNTKPEKIDIDKIYNEIHKEPQDAYISKEPFEFHPHVEGVDFAISIDEAKKMLEEEKEQYKIPLKIIKPKITNNSLGDEAFPDKLSSFSTKFSTANTNRAENIRISVNKINNVILMPGEEFSYNNILGPRTPEAGYKLGAAYIGGKVVSDYGGGVCQTSSTLYNAVLLSNLEITSRTSHYFATDYVAVGRDATVYWPTLDFKFKNNRNYPIKIKAVVNGGTILVDILGLKEETDYEVEIQSYVTSYIPIKVEYEDDNSLAEGKEIVKQAGSSGIRSETYKILKKDGNIISKTLVSRDVYSGKSKIIRRGTKKVEPENAQ